MKTPKFSPGKNEIASRFVPIQLDKNGNFLRASLSGNRLNDLRDSDRIGYGASPVHAFCNGSMDVHPQTETTSVLTCRACYARFEYPKELRTYGELRKWLASRV